MRRKSTGFFLLTIVIFLMASPFSAIAKISDYIPIYTGDNYQIYPAAAWNSKQREYLAVWHDKKNSGIYGLRIDPNGGSNGSPFEIGSIKDPEDGNHPPSIAYDFIKDQYLITWHDDPNGSILTDICAVLVSSNGENIKPLNIPKAEERQINPKVAWNGKQFFIVWYDFRNGMFTGDLKDADIYGVRLDPNGEALDLNGLEICTDNSAQVDPVVAGYSDGGKSGWLVSWVDERNTSSGKDIYAALINQKGQLVKQNFPLCIAEKDQENVEIAIGPAGFFLVWHDERMKGTQNFYGEEYGNFLVGARLSWDGNILGGYQNREIGITMIESGTFVPSIAYVQNNFLVTWHHDSKIKGARVSWEGDVFLDINTATGELEPFILSDPNKTASNSSIAAVFSPSGDNEPDEKVFIAWQILHDDTLQDIWGVMYTPPEPPLLQWVGTGVFEVDGVDPDSGEGGDTFTFKVKYEESQEGSSKPLVHLLQIDLNHNGFYEQNERFEMEAEGEDSLVYQIEKTILYDGDPNDPDIDTVAYSFYFRDEYNIAVGDPNAVNDPAGEHLLSLGEKGHVPYLSWLGTGNFKEDGLHPDKIEVDADSAFTFKVNYQDEDNNGPVIHQVWIDINRNSSFEDSEEYTEKFDLSSEGSNYSTGVTYSLEKDLVVNWIGLLAYRFYFDDGANVAQGEPKRIQYLNITNTSESCIYSGIKPQINPDIALTDMGGLIVWEDLRNAYSADPNLPIFVQNNRIQGIYEGSEIYGLLLNPADGVPYVGNNYGEIRIGTPNKNQFNPRVAGRDKVFLVVWEDLRNGNIVTNDLSPYENWDIYGQIVVTDPNSQIEEFAVATYTDEDKSNPAVAVGAQNKFLVVWEDGLDIIDNGRDIYGTIVSYDPITSTPEVSHDPDRYTFSESAIIKRTSDQTNPAAAWADNAHRYLVVWQHSTYLYANAVDPNGQVLGGLNINTAQYESGEYNKSHGNPICVDTGGDASSPAITSDGEKFLIVWEYEKGTDTGKDIYGIFVNPNGIVLSIDPNGEVSEIKNKTRLVEAQIPLCTVDGDQTNPHVYWDESTQKYHVVWTSQPLYKNTLGTYEGGEDTDIRGVWIDSRGQLIASTENDAGWEVCSMTGTQSGPAISGNGNIKRVVWMDDRNVYFSGSPIFEGLSVDIFSIPLRSFLQWPDGEDYSTGVNPAIGGNGKEYTFKINYLDGPEDPNNTYEYPSVSQVWIDLNGDGEYDTEEKHDMSLDPNDPNSPGWLYFKTLSLALPDDYQGNGKIGYRFYFEDEAGFPATGSANSQKTFQINPPWLWWTGETNYQDDGVNPSTGSTDTSFKFRVVYMYVNPSDPDAETFRPDIAQIWIDFDHDGDYEDNEILTLSEDDFDDQDYTDGKIYTYSLKKGHSEGTYNYRFYFEHPKGGIAIGEPTKDHQFTISGYVEKNWTIYTTEDGLASNRIQCLLAQGSTLWVGTDAGLNRFRDESWETFTSQNESGLASSYITDLALDSTAEVLYVGTLGGLSSYNGSSWKRYGKEDTDGVFEQQYISVWYLGFDKSHQRMWMVVTQASQKGTDIEEIDPNSAELSLVCHDIGNSSWKKYTKENTSSHTGGGLPSENLLDLTVDDRGDVWVSTFVPITDSEENVRWEGQGVSQFDPDEERWTHYTISSDTANILETDLFYKIQADEQGNLWCGGLPPAEGKNEKAGLYQFDIYDGKWINHFSKGQPGVKLGSNIINALCADGSDLWVGTTPTTEDGTDGGASVYKGDSDSWGDLYTTQSTDGGLVSNGITAIAVQSDEVWFGTLMGLSRYGYGEGGGHYEPPADPNRTFRFPNTRGCFADSFSDVVNKKSILNYSTLWFWWVLFSIGILGIGIGFFSMVRRYIWLTR